MDEKKAIRLCLKHRDPAGFEALVDQNQRRAFFHAHALLGNQEDAADACQDAFIRAFAGLPKLDSLERFYPWFHKILRNVCLNMLQKSKTRSNHLHELSNQSLPHHQGESPDSLISTMESRAQVWQLLNQLSPDHREILTLKYIHSFSYQQIAETLEIPRGTVMSRLYAARSSFRSQYDQVNSSCDEETNYESR